MPHYGDDWHAHLQRAVGRFWARIEPARRNREENKAAEAKAAFRELPAFVEDAAEWCGHWDEFEGTTSTNFTEYRERDIEAAADLILKGIVSRLGEAFRNDCGSQKAILVEHWIKPVFQEGRQAFALRRADLPPTEWSEAKPPAEWCRELNVSASTLRRYRSSGKLIVDAVTTKLWRIRRDSLRRYRGDK